jgi:predicted O-linked N-acetylglucosamine transferase (SPINDLY family)
LKQAVGQRALQNARARKQLGKDAGQIFAQAAALHAAGNHAAAQALCERLLQHLPDHFDALHLLGASKSDTGQFAEAVEILKRALAIQPRSAVAHYHLGLAQFALKQFNAARASYEMAVSIQPNFPLALNNLGNALNELGLREQAIEQYNRAVAYQSDYADAFYNRGSMLLLLGRHAEALASLNRCLAVQPAFPRALNAQGLALIELRRVDEALVSFERALAIEPDFANAISGRGRALAELRRFDEALACQQQALDIAPDLITAQMGLGYLLLLTGRLEEAFTAARRALALEESASALALMGQCFALRGDTDEAIDHFDRALALQPNLESAITTKVFALDFVHGAGFAQHQEARKAWWDQVGSRVAPASPAVHANDRDPARRIVVGYVSSDFRNHSAALCFIVVLRNHDKAAFEVVCYSCSPLRDGRTEELERLADKWVDASRMPDDELAARIRADKIDILVDLSGHTAGNRLAVFARKPAPIAVTAWGSPTGTGSPTTDYLFADPVVIPSEVRHLFAEQVYDLPCVATIDPPPAIAVAEPPCLTKGTTTFGVFNRINKISPQAVKVWCEILHALPRSRLMIKHPALDDAGLRRHLTGRFTALGIAADRIECAGTTSRGEHLAAYGQVDICLDPFPQNGGIGTWEPLQMGVPVVAKLGDSFASRVSGAILTSIGLSEWIADGDAGYIALALKLAAAPDYLQTMRHELPGRIAGSVAGNPVAYTRAVEDAYRAFWRRYCGSADAALLSP